MIAAHGQEAESLHALLLRMEQLTYVVADHDQHQFERLWRDYGDFITPYLTTTAVDRERWLDAFEKYLLSGPAYEKNAKDISRATVAELRKLECAYDVWNVLETWGRRVYVRGSDKQNRPWDIHERPLTASSRWYVKACLAINSDGPGGRIELFRLAAEEARQGSTNHCLNRAKHMDAYILHYKAMGLLGSATDESVFEDASELFARASRLAEPVNEDGGQGHAEHEAFFRSLCQLQAAEVALDLGAAQIALQKAIAAVRSLSNPEGPFRTPNPWTSLRDLENESRFIAILSKLQSDELDELEPAIKELDGIIADCEVSERKEELRTRLLVLKGLKATRDGHAGEFERHYSQAKKSTERIRAGKRSMELVKILQKASSSSAKKVLSDVVRQLPLGVVGIGDPSLPAPLLYSAPSWLKKLSNTSSQDEARALLLWYVRLILDYFWSVCERDAYQEGRRLGARPMFADLPYLCLPERLGFIRSLLKGKGEPAIEMATLAARVPSLIGQLAAPGSDFVDSLEVLIRDTQRWLFPLAVLIKRRNREGLTLRRVDALHDEYSFEMRAVDDSAIQPGAQVAYVKARLGRITGRPMERGGKPLVLYPAPAYPNCSRTCLIVEGPSDKAFFEIMLDRIEPGYQAIRVEPDFSHQIIEIRDAGGASGVPEAYFRARKEGAFHSNDPLLDAGAERIAVVVDGDHRDVLVDTHEDVSRCRHRCVLHPDLERIALPGFRAAAEIVLGRALNSNELRELHNRLDSPGNEFANWVWDTLGLALKRRSTASTESFAVLLARAFPDAEPGAKWNVVWEICNRVLQLAKRPRRTATLSSL